MSLVEESVGSSPSIILPSSTENISHTPESTPREFRNLYFQFSGTCYRCKKEGHIARYCSQGTTIRGEQVPPTNNVHILPIQCPCGAGTCLVRTSNTAKNPKRQFYTCSVNSRQKCNFFKWCDELKSVDNVSSYLDSPLPTANSYNQCIECPCGAGTCILKTSHTSDNPKRQFYTCPAQSQNCNYFRWCDEVKNDESVLSSFDYPTCACGAGKCRIFTANTGNYAGQKTFICPVKKGQGACNFVKLLDENFNRSSSNDINITTESNSFNTSSGVSQGIGNVSQKIGEIVVKQKNNVWKEVYDDDFECNTKSGEIKQKIEVVILKQNLNIKRKVDSLKVSERNSKGLKDSNPIFYFLSPTGQKLLQQIQETEPDGAIICGASTVENWVTADDIQSLLSKKEVPNSVIDALSKLLIEWQDSSLPKKTQDPNLCGFNIFSSLCRDDLKEQLIDRHLSTERQRYAMFPIVSPKINKQAANNYWTLLVWDIDEEVWLFCNSLRPRNQKEDYYFKETLKLGQGYCNFVQQNEIIVNRRSSDIDHANSCLLENIQYDEIGISQNIPNNSSSEVLQGMENHEIRITNNSSDNLSSEVSQRMKNEPEEIRDEVDGDVSFLSKPSVGELESAKHKNSLHNLLHYVEASSIGYYAHGWWGRLAFPPCRFIAEIPPKPFYCCVFPCFDLVVVPLDVDVIQKDKGSVILKSPLLTAKVDQPLPLITPAHNNPSSASTQVPKPCKVDGSSSLSPSFLEVFRETAVHIQKKLVTLFWSLDPLDDEGMMREANSAFEALECLKLDYEPFRNRVIKFISSVTLVKAKIEQREATFKERIDWCHSKNDDLVDLTHICAGARGMLARFKESIEILRGDVFRLRAILVQFEGHLSCCNAKTMSMETKLELMCRDKLESERIVQILWKKALREGVVLENEKIAMMETLKRSRMQLLQGNDQN